MFLFLVSVIKQPIMQHNYEKIKNKTHVNFQVFPQNNLFISSTKLQISQNILLLHVVP